MLFTVSRVNVFHNFSVNCNSLVLRKDLSFMFTAILFVGGRDLLAWWAGATICPERDDIESMKTQSMLRDDRKLHNEIPLKHILHVVCSTFSSLNTLFRAQRFVDVCYIFRPFLLVHPRKMFWTNVPSSNRFFMILSRQERILFSHSGFVCGIKPPSLNFLTLILEWWKQSITESENEKVSETIIHFWR